MEALFKQMEDFAKENKVPIINENGRKVFIEIIKKYKPQRVLEIGTAIGYSALLTTYYGAENVKIISLELDEERKQIVRQAEKDISKHDYSKDNVIIFDSSKYEEGIAGIIAGKLIEKYNKPAIVVHKKENSDIYKGSVRSISGINIFTALTANKKVNSNLVECGGHAEAAGLSFKKENLNNLQQSLNEVVQINIEEVEPTIDIDGYISFKDINNNTLNSINTLAYDKE